MLTETQQKRYEQFYESTHHNEFLDAKTELLVGLAAAIAMNCEPCSAYYMKELQKLGAKKGEVQEVLAKVMAVSAGQKKLQTQRAFRDFNIDLDNY